MPLRAFYFFNFGALGALFPFLPLLFQERGLDATGISLVMVVVPATSLAVPPLWGLLADALGSRLLLLRIASFGSALSVLLLLPDWGFAGTVLAMVAYSLFRAPLTSLADAAVFDAMGGERADFSTVRVFGSVGFAVFVSLLGALEGSGSPALLLGLTAGVHVLSAVVLLPIGAPPLRRERGVLRAAVSVIRRPAVILFLVATAAYYAGHSAYDVYFGLHARRLGQGDGFVGLAWAIGVAAEIVVMLAAPRFIHRARSGVFLALAAVAAAGRWALLSVVEAPSAILATQLLHGLTFGLWYLALAKHVQARAPAHLRTSLQAVALSCMGVGQLAGYLGGGQLFAQVAGQGVFQAATAAAVVAFLLYGVVAVFGSGRGKGVRRST